MSSAINTKVAKNDTIIRKLFQTTMITMMIAELSGALSSVIDGLITGFSLGQIELAALGVCLPYYSILSIISGILMIGCSAMCTSAIGRGDSKETSSVFSLTVLIGGMLSVTLTILGLSFPDGIANLFGAKAEAADLHRETVNYLRGVVIGAPALVFFVVLTPILQLDGDTKRPQLASALMAITDIAGDLLNVYVFHGGVYGMALASSVSHIVAFITILTHFTKKSGLFRFSLSAIRFDMIPALTKGGFPRAVCMLSRTLLPIFMNTLVLALVGSTGVTALSAQSTLSFTIASLGWGIGGAVSIMGGMMVGEQDEKGLEEVIRTALWDILIGVTAISVVVFLAAPYISALFVPEAGDTQKMTVDAIRSYTFALPFFAFNVMCANYLQAITRIFASTLVNIGIEVAFTAVSAYILSTLFGTMGIWLSYFCGQAILSLVLFVIAAVKKDPSRHGLAAHMVLKKDFGVPEKDRIERSLNTMDEVVEFSEDVSRFCMEHKLGSKESNRLALCVEEMAGNVIEHGFTGDKPHHLDVRVLVKGESVILRMRDDCEKFDLCEKAQKWSFDPEHPEKNIGIRIVLKLAKDISYTNTMNTNNLIITV